MLSLNLRVLIVASIVLVSFFGIAGFTLDRAYYLTAEKALKDRLLGQIYALIATTGVDENNNIFIPDIAPDVLYFLAGPDMYAQIAANNGRVIWRSPSLDKFSLSFPTGLSRNESAFAKVKLPQGPDFAIMSYGVGWDDRVKQHVFIYSVAENMQTFEHQVNGFRRTLWGWLGGVGLVLLVAQGSIMRWGLAPLQTAAEELSAIEEGKKTRLSHRYPGELQGLTNNLNALLDHQNEHLERYRHTVGDLAHSLKTPLAVLQSSVEEGLSFDELKRIVQEQVDRMNQITEYQLQRAATAGQRPLGAPVPVWQVSKKILSGLQKVYADKNVRVELGVGRELEFHGDEGDLMEMLGNLVDNAFKWCRSIVKVTIADLKESDLVHQGIHIIVEDDGPGIPSELARQVTERGVRADQGISGHGIGLSIVQDIVHVYGGRLTIGESAYGGAAIDATLLTRR
jgi:two-component system sensor histidine kinase PhoQ